MHPTFAIVSARDERIDLATSAADPSPFVLDEETTGLGFVDRDVQLAASTGDGGRFRGSRLAPRPISLVVDVWGATPEEVTERTRTLGRVLRRVNGLPLPHLEATLPDGTVYTLPVIHDSGGDTLRRVPVGGVQVVALSLTAPDPLWTARDATPFRIRGLASTGTFLPGLAEMHLTSSAANGVLDVDNEGDGDAYPVWQLIGPTTKATISLGAASWTFGPIAAGETVTIDVRTRTARLADGTNVYERFGVAPRLFPIPPGANRLSVLMTNAAADTAATCFFRPRLEVIV